MSNTIVLEQLISGTDAEIASGEIPRRQRIYILPTRQGIIFAIMLFAMLLGAINYNNSMAYILTFLLASIYMLAILHTYRNIAGLHISSTRPEPVFAGETALFPICFDNRDKSLRPAINLQLTSRSKSGLLKLKRKTVKKRTVSMVDIETDDITRIFVPVNSYQRGLLSLDRIIISSCFPLGLFRAWSYLDFDQYCIVYPKPSGRLEFPQKILVDEQGQLGLATGTDDFAGFRRYHQGDSIKNIAWKALAHGQELLVKKFSGNESLKLSFLWEDVQDLPDIEQRLSQLCLWILEAERSGINYQLEIPGKLIATGAGEFHKLHCLEALARFGYE